MDPGRVDIDMVEEILAHEGVVALWIVRRQITVLVQIHGSGSRKIQISFFIPNNQLPVNSER